MPKRRHILSGVFAGVSLALAGCSSGDGVGTQGPEEVTRAYVKATFNGDYEEAESYTFGMEREEITPEIVAEVSAREPSLEEITSTTETEEEAAVTYVLSTDTTGETRTLTQTALLIKNSENWLVTYTSETKHEPEVASNFDKIDEGDPVDIAVSVTKSVLREDSKAVSRNSTKGPEANLIATNYSSNYTLNNINVHDFERSGSQSTVVLECDLTHEDGGSDTHNYVIQLQKADNDWLVDDFELDVSTI